MNIELLKDIKAELAGQKQELEQGLSRLHILNQRNEGLSGFIDREISKLEKEQTKEDNPLEDIANVLIEVFGSINKKVEPELDKVANKLKDSVSAHFDKIRQDDAKEEDVSYDEEEDQEEDVHDYYNTLEEEEEQYSYENPITQFTFSVQPKTPRTFQVGDRVKASAAGLDYVRSHGFGHLINENTILTVSEVDLNKNLIKVKAGNFETATRAEYLELI